LLLQITINRPDRRNAFRPLTVKELMRAFNDARDDSSIGVIILTGKVGMLSEDKQKKKHLGVYGVGLAVVGKLISMFWLTREPRRSVAAVTRR
jgi:hypothetical protein